MENTDNRKNTILIIGNGYDIASGYKTRYSDFVADETFKRLIDNNLLCKHINEIDSHKYWVELEVELYKYSNKLASPGTEANPDDTRKFYDDYIELKLALQDYLIKQYTVHIPKDEINTYNNLMKLQNNWIQTNQVKEIIIFNYTQNTWLNFNKYIDKDLFKQVHGKIDPQKKEMTEKIVLGIDEIMKVNKDHSFLYKASDRNLRIDGLSKSIETAEKYIFFGCSFGETDYWYYSKILNQKNKEFEIYHFGKNGLTEIINNIKTIYGCLMDFKNDNQCSFFDSSRLSEIIK